MLFAIIELTRLQSDQLIYSLKQKFCTESLLLHHYFICSIFFLYSLFVGYCLCFFLFFFLLHSFFFSLLSFNLFFFPQYFLLLFSLLDCSQCFNEIFKKVPNKILSASISQLTVLILNYLCYVLRKPQRNNVVNNLAVVF